MRTDWTISACCHVVVLGAALVSFSPARLPATQVESIAVNIVTDTDKSEMTQGQTNAPKEAKNPFVDKIGEPEARRQSEREDRAERSHRVDRCGAAAVASRAQAGGQAEAGAQARPDRRSAQEGRRQEGRAEEGGREESRRENPDAAEAAATAEQNQPKFDPREMQALLDKRDPQRKEATGDHAQRRPVAWHRQRQGGAAFAERTRRVEGAACAALESAGRSARIPKKSLLRSDSA